MENLTMGATLRDFWPGAAAVLTRQWEAKHTAHRAAPFWVVKIRDAFLDVPADREEDYAAMLAAVGRAFVGEVRPGATTVTEVLAYGMRLLAWAGESEQPQKRAASLVTTLQLGGLVAANRLLEGEVQVLKENEDARRKKRRGRYDP